MGARESLKGSAIVQATPSTPSASVAEPVRPTPTETASATMPTIAWTLDVCGVCNGKLCGLYLRGARNYDLGTTLDDNSCVFEAPPVVGCTDATACNYNAQAVSDDGTCYFAPASTDAMANACRMKTAMAFAMR